MTGQKMGLPRGIVFRPEREFHLKKAALSTCAATILHRFIAGLIPCTGPTRLEQQIVRQIPNGASSDNQRP